MARSNTIIGTINSVAILLSIPVICSGVWIAAEAKNACFTISQLPFIIIGILIIVVALSGAVGGFRGIQPLVVCYYFGMIIVMILLTSLVAFYSIVTAADTRYAPGIPRRVHDISDFIRDVTSFGDNVTACVKSANICAGLNQTYHTAKDVSSAHLTTVQSGCCAPPRNCNLTFVYSTYSANGSQTRFGDSDCWRWSPDKKILCYTCDNCKIGLVRHLNTKFKRANIILIITLITLIIVYSMGCFGLKNAKLEDLFH